MISAFDIFLKTIPLVFVPCVGASTVFQIFESVSVAVIITVFVVPLPESVTVTTGPCQSIPISSVRAAADLLSAVSWTRTVCPDTELVRVRV